MVKNGKYLEAFQQALSLNVAGRVNRIQQCTA